MARVPDIEIVVPVCGASGASETDAHALRATLASLLDQTETDFRVRVAHPEEVPVELPVADERFRLAPVSASTWVEILAAGLASSEAAWIRFLPPGDQLAPGCLAAESEAIADDPDLGAVLAGTEAIDVDGVVVPEPGEGTAPIAPGRHAPGALLPDVVAAEPLPLGAGLLRREVAVLLGGFDPSLTARPEHDLWLRVLRGHAVVRLPLAGLRARTPRLPAVDPALDGAERARIVLRTLRGEVLEEVVRALGGGERDAPPQAIARTELARRVLHLSRRLGRGELRPLVWRLLREARAAGGYFPLDEAFADLALDFPELARLEGWFRPPGPPAVAEAFVTPPAAALPGPFPAAARVALLTADAVDDAVGIEAARALAAERGAFRAHGVELLVMHARSSRDAPTPEIDTPIEILRHPGSVDEAEAALARWGIALVVGAPEHPAARAARRCGIPTRVARPSASEDPAAIARDWLREAASGAAGFRRAASLDHEAAALAVAGGATEDGSLRALVAAIGDAGFAARAAVDAGDLLGRLAATRDEAAGVRRKVGEAQALDGRALDKLRIGRRLRQALSGPRGEGATAGVVRSLDEASARRFLARAAGAAAAAPVRLWVVYTTDPYSETQGQRSTWLARELLARGDHVVFFYWRWHLSDEILASPHERLLSAPIDQLFRLQRPLLDLAAPGLEKIFLVEFPDRHLYEQIDLAGAHGFTTVYDCVDDWEEFARLGHAHWFESGFERHLARYADVVVATHPALVRRLEEMGRPGALLVPNGVALDALGDAAPRARRGAPVVGYFGHLTPAWFDWDLIRETAAAHPEWTFEILGPGAPDDLSVPDNVLVPGPVPHAEIERRTRGWHAAVVPFRPGRLTAAVDPIKLYEYLALGLPAVVVAMPHLEGVPGVEVCAREGFADALARALAADFDHEAVRAFLDASRWSARVDAVVGGLAEACRGDLLKAL